MARTKADIENVYKSALEAAEPFRDSDPETFNARRTAAAEAKMNALEAWAEERDQSATATSLAAARSAALSKYPNALTLQQFVSGSTPEEIEASAKAIHDNIAQRENTIREEARQGSRAQRAQIYRPGVPGSENAGPGSEGAQVDQVRAASQRLMELNQMAGTPRDMRSATALAGNEAQALADIRATRGLPTMQDIARARSVGGDSPMEDRG